eukprot:TRINITY_DN131_c0_g3_i6.p1 TRINITY_DN131_c0_g3~~TRINITY_DN131_c0_g3_i6.p1  ORF type:complete len:1496 (+),score=557.26 TRINITY_DN131_c0_g3_i6:93-4490(+)
MRAVSSLLLATLAATATAGAGAASSCASAGLKLHGGRVPYAAVGSTDPSSARLDDLFHFETYALRTPHGHGVSLEETDRMHDALCATEGAVRDAIGSTDSPVGAGDVLLGAPPGVDAAAELHAREALHSNFLDVMLGDGATRAKAVKRDAAAVNAGTTTHFEGQIAEDGAAAQRFGDDDGDVLLEESSEGDMPRIGASTWANLAIEAEIPIPPLPVVNLGLALSIETIVAKNYRYMAAKTELDIGVGLPPAKPVVKVFIGLTGKMRISGTGSTTNSMSLPGLVLGNVQHGIYAQSDRVKRAAIAGAAGVAALANTAGTPTHPSNILEQYIEGFEKEYVDLLGDEWTYVTDAGTANDGVAAGLPSDDTILQAIEWIEKMLGETPEQKDNGDLVWKYTASAWFLFTSDLRYRLAEDGTWTWSPDNEHWMPITELAVRGGRFNGQQPTTNNIKTIKAIELIFVTLGGRHMAAPNGNGGGDDSSAAEGLSDVAYSSQCFDRGGVCLDSSRGATCSSGWITGLCRGSAAIKCCVDAGETEARETDLLVQDTTTQTETGIFGGAEDPCDCETDGGRIGSYNPSAWGDQCRKWGGTSYDWCYINARSATACRKYTVTASRGRYWRRCGFGVWASATTRDVKRTATQVSNTVDRGLDRVAETTRARVETAREHLDNAAEAVSESVDNIARTTRARVETAREHLDNAAEAVSESVDNIARTTRARVETAREHLDNAADAASESIDNVIDRVRGTLTAAQENMVRRARELVANVNTNWREIKRTFSETGAFRFVQRTWFNDNAPKNPLLVFKGLASRMEHEGFSAEDNLFERALFKADAAVFRDYTRVLSIREALFAFCKKNARVKGVMEHMRNVVRNDEAFTARTRQTPDIEVPASMRGKTDMSAKMSAVNDVPVEGADTAGFRPERDFAKNGIRKAAVDRELSAKDPNGATMGDADALELYALLSEQVIERFEHIQRMAQMVATRFQRLNKSTWTALTAAQKEEYRGYFFSLRRLAGGLKTLLVQINHGDGPIKRSIVRGTQWLSTKVASVCDNLKATMAAKLGENDWKLSSKYYLTVQLGVSGKVPTPMPISAELLGGYSCGISTIVTTQHLEDPKKTYSSTYCGLSFDATVKLGQRTPGAPHFVGIAKVENRNYNDETYCVKKFGRAPCTERFFLLLSVFPTNLGLSPATVMPVIKTMLAVGLANDLGVISVSEGDVNPGVFAGSASGEDIISLSNYITPDGGAPPAEPDSLFNGAQNLLHGALPEVFAARGEENTEVSITPEAETESRGNRVFNALKDYGPAAFALIAGQVTGGNLGVLSFLYTYKIGEGASELSGVDKVFVKPFFMNSIASVGGAIKAGIQRMASMTENLPLKVGVSYDFGILVWIVLPGGAKRAVANAANAASENTANLAVAAGDELPCDQSFIASRLTSLREAVHIAKRGDDSVRDDVLAALKDMEAYERECAVHKQ